MFNLPSLTQLGLKRAAAILTRPPATAQFSTITKQSFMKSIPKTLKPNFISKSAGLRSTRSSSSLKLLFASTGSFLLLSSLSLSPSNRIYNDSILKDNRIDISDLQPAPGYRKSRFGGKLNYEELTIGSVTGLFLGIIIGKLSSVFMFFTLSCYFMLEFLESRNIIHIPWTYIITVGKDKVDLKELVLQKPSFKISFVLAFIIAAYNI
ncbi:uncharacterized protein J8A68_000353 [[Candida] subhashii]|uniref:Uncharacterized protein n=1 Tax=[Candida] subhashii TaxID=561895 RepID=A0A8J5QWN2_9ASCO|nr:uncharacterized protein J8A68_000353 [[Candida] subhashii]KAG7666097.1 hypothetical protein J8A68_000353 [[Candida] subhashii]